MSHALDGVVGSWQTQLHVADRCQFRHT